VEYCSQRYGTKYGNIQAMIHCIGNSHANVFVDAHPANMFNTTYLNNFSSTSIGPVIAYNFYDHHLNKVYDVLKKVKKSPNDYVMLIVGEVDCRWHLPKRIDSNKEEISVVVKECIDRFFKSVLELQSHGYKLVSWCGHPSTTAGHDDNPNEPVWGECLFRNKISIEWAKYLTEISNNNNIKSINITNDLIMENGITNMTYFNDYCHLNHNKIMPLVLNKCRELNIL